MLPIGFSGGYSSQAAKKTEKQTGEQSGRQDQTFSAPQSSLQNELVQYLRSILPGMAGGTMTPQVNAMKTASAGAINKTAAGTGDRLNRFYASRGMGQSGMAGKAALNTELSRQGALAGNEAAYSGLQLDQNSRLLSEALKAAFQSIGQTSSGEWSSLLDSITKSSGFSLGAKVGF